MYDPRGTVGAHDHSRIDYSPKRLRVNAPARRARMKTPGLQALANSVSGIGYLAAQGAIAVFMTPFLLRALGATTYGLIPLSSSVVSYSAILSMGLQMSISRHLTVSRWREDISTTSATFSSAVVMATLVGASVWIVVGVVAFNVGALFRLPPEVVPAARLFLLMNGLYYALTILASALGSVCYAHGRVDLQNAIRFGDLAIRSLVPLVAFAANSRDLAWVGVGLVLAALWTSIASLLLWKRMAPQIVLSVRSVRRSLLRRLYHTSVWGTVDNIGALLHLSTDVLVLSVAISTSAAGVYGALLQWVVFVRGVVAAVNGGAEPLVMRRYAAGEVQDAWRMSRTMMRICGCLAGVCCGILLASSSVLIARWLGAPYAIFSPVLVVLISALPLTLAVSPLATYQVAADRVRVPALIMLATGLVNLVLSVALVHMQPTGIGVALATLFALTLKTLLFTPAYVSRIIHRPLPELYGLLAPACVVTAAAYAAMRTILSFSAGSSLVGLAVRAAVTVALTAPVVWWVGLRREDRELARRLLPIRAESVV